MPRARLQVYPWAPPLRCGDALKGSIYERELKDIFEGRRAVLMRMGKRLNTHQRRCYFSTLHYPFVVIRAAGSLGMDLVVLRGDFSFPIEVKSSSSDVFRFSSSSGKAELQAEQMVQQCSRSHLLPFYAFRLKGERDDPWRIFAMPLGDNPDDIWWLQESHGTFARLLMSKVPAVDRTAKGARVMRWRDGYPLSSFLEYLWNLNVRRPLPEVTEAFGVVGGGSPAPGRRGSAAGP